MPWGVGRMPPELFRTERLTMRRPEPADLDAVLDGGARDPDTNADEPAGPDFDRADSRARLQVGWTSAPPHGSASPNSRIGVAKLTDRRSSVRHGH